MRVPHYGYINMERKLNVWGKIPKNATKKPEYALLLKEMGYTIEANKLDFRVALIMQYTRLHGNIPLIG